MTTEQSWVQVNVCTWYNGIPCGGSWYITYHKSMRSQWCWPLTPKFYSVHPWVQLTVCTKFEKIPWRCSWDIRVHKVKNASCHWLSPLQIYKNETAAFEVYGGLFICWSLKLWSTNCSRCFSQHLVRPIAAVCVNGSVWVEYWSTFDKRATRSPPIWPFHSARH